MAVPSSAFLGSKLKSKDPRRESLTQNSPWQMFTEDTSSEEFFLKLSLKKKFLRMWRKGECEWGEGMDKSNAGCEFKINESILQVRHHQNIFFSLGFN